MDVTPIALTPFMPAKKKTALTRPSTTVTGSNPALVSDLRRLILDAREQVARAVDSGLVLLYWSIGNRVRTDVLNEKRAEYGQKILHAVSTKLVAEFGQGTLGAQPGEHDPLRRGVSRPRNFAITDCEIEL